MRIRLLFEPRDIWIGVYWRRERRQFGPGVLWVYICLLPMLPIRIRIQDRWRRAYL